MATTTNFGWVTPDDTSLVKDGAAAIRTLGQSIDTSMMDLEGGTTGQVLSKASNTDMDFTWVTSDDANAIQNAIVDAKGDLIAATAADTPARLAVGTNGHVLTADSTAATGLKWAAPAGGGKILQIVNATTTTATLTSSTSPQATSVTATITPSATSSKVLIMVTNQIFQTNNQFNPGYLRVYRPNTSGTQMELAAENQQNIGNGALVIGATLVGIDSPATTSATTYIQSIHSGNSGQQVSVSGRQNIILMEIGA